MLSTGSRMFRKKHFVENNTRTKQCTVLFVCTTVWRLIVLSVFSLQRRFIDDDCKINLCNTTTWTCSRIALSSSWVRNEWIIESPPPTLKLKIFCQYSDAPNSNINLLRLCYHPPCWIKVEWINESAHSLILILWNIKI